MVRVDGDLDPESGETLLTALRAVLDTDARSRGRDDTGRRRSDGPTRSERSADNGWTAAPDRSWPASGHTSQ
jgi:hypothetical protein